MTDVIVFDFIAGAVFLQDHTGELRKAPEVIELVATNASEAPDPGE
jgi:hypothetical protein